MYMLLLLCIKVGVSNERLENVSVNLTCQRGMVLPFEPLSITFNEIRYAVDMPQVSSIKLLAIYFEINLNIFISESH